MEGKIKTADRLKCPKDMSPVAKKEWKRIMGLYRQMEADILNDLDITALTMYCESFAQYKSAQADWVKVQKVVTTNQTNQRTLDKIRDIMNDQVKVVCQLSEQLCLTPVGRARMGIAMAKKKEQSSLAKLFQGGDDDDTPEGDSEEPSAPTEEEEQ